MDDLAEVPSAQRLIMAVPALLEILSSDTLDWPQVARGTARLLEEAGVELVRLRVPGGAQLAATGEVAEPLDLPEVHLADSGLQPLEVEGWAWAALAGIGADGPVLVVGADHVPGDEAVGWVRLMGIGCALVAEVLRAHGAAAGSGEPGPGWDGDGAGDGGRSIATLLRGVARPDAALEAARLGYPVERSHAVLVVDATGVDPLARRDALARFLRLGDLGHVTLVNAGQVLAAVWADPGVAAGPSLQDAIGPCRAGLSGWRPGVAALPEAVAEARTAARFHDPAGGAPLARYEDLGVFGLLAEGNRDEVQRFVRDWLGPVIDHDVARGAELEQTLATYLGQGGSLDRAAALLHVHRSTLKHRLSRVRQLTGLDLGDPDVRFNLQMATRASAVLRAVGGAPGGPVDPALAAQAMAGAGPGPSSPPPSP